MSHYYTNEHIGQSPFYFWYGQVLGDWEGNESGKIQNRNDSPGWGKRYKVAILGRDERAVDKGADNNSLAMAEVLLPVTAGSGLGGGVQTPNIAQNTFVVGFYKDGINCREPIIMGLLPNFSQTVCAAYSGNDTERFNPASGFKPQDPVAGFNMWKTDELIAGSIIKESNDGTFVNAFDVRRTIQLKEGARSHYVPRTYKCDGSGGEMVGIAKAIQDAVNLLNQIKSEILSFSNALSSIQSTIKKVINTVALYVTSLVKNLIQKMRSYILNQINKATSAALNLIPPNLRYTSITGIQKSTDVLNCVFNKIINRLIKLVTDTLTNLIDGAVNTAMCAAEHFIGGLLSNILGEITSAVDSALNSIGGLLNGSLSVAGQVINGIDTVIGYLKFFTCEDELACPNIQQWSFWYGANDFTQKVSDKLSSILGNISQNYDQTTICSTGPVLCGPPTIELVGGGGGFGFSANPIISSVGSVLGFDIINPGQNYTSTPIVNFNSDCGIGNGAVLMPIVAGLGTTSNAGVGTTSNAGIGTTSNVGLGTTSNAGIGTTSNAGIGTTSNTSGGIIDIVVIDGGVGYLSSPNGSTGGGGQVFSTPDQTIIYTLDINKYQVFVPGELVEVEKGEFIYMPAGSNTQLYDENGNVIQNIFGQGQITGIELLDNGVLTIPNKPDTQTMSPSDPTRSNGSYPVVLSIKKIIVANPGINYRENDKIVISPSCGAELDPKYDDFGRLVSVAVLKDGIGFTDIPDIYIESLTGINARMIPLFNVIRVGDLPEEQDIVPIGTPIINVVDCVGRVF